MPTKEELKRFSLSQNFYAQVVRPLYESGNVVNLDGLLDLLKKLTSSLWTRSGRCDGFSGAIAGNFQEILDGYRHAVLYKQKVQFGSVGGIGGDTVRTVVDSKHMYFSTTQFKVTSSGVDAIEEHIQKAAWQLTGAGGESPPSGENVVEVIVQDDQVEDEGRNKTLANFTSDDWSAVIKEALANGYTQNYIAKTKEELYSATQRVVITTRGFRFVFMPFLGEVLYMGGGVPKPQEGSIFAGSRFEAHWRWLTSQIQPIASNYNYKDVQKHGIGPSTHDVPAALLLQR
jgi:hypothetical protein